MPTRAPMLPRTDGAAKTAVTRFLDKIDAVDAVLGIEGSSPPRFEATRTRSRASAPSALAAWSQLRSVALEAAHERGRLRIVPAGPRADGGPQDGMHPLSIRDDSGR
jgi:hypothetical protein